MLRGHEVVREAGQDGSQTVPVLGWRGLVGYQQTIDVDLRVASLPDGRDPDDLIRTLASDAAVGGRRADFYARERRLQRQQEARDDLAVAHRGFLARPRDAEDRHLGVVDDRDRAGPPERADVGDRERPAAQIVERRLAVPHALGDLTQLVAALESRCIEPDGRS